MLFLFLMLKKDHKNSDKLKIIFVTFIVSQIISDSEKKEYCKIFNHLDKNKDGILSREELITGFFYIFCIIIL